MADLPALVTECVEEWQLEIRGPFETASHSHVAPGTRSDGLAIILKLVPPPVDAYTWEEAALRWYGGQGAARLIASALSRRALLLERVVPGDRMSTLVHEDGEEEALMAAAGVMRRLWTASDDGTLPDVPRIEEDLDVLARHRRHRSPDAGTRLRDLLDRAETVGRELVRSAPPPVLIHGDLHHDNMLSSGAGAWLAVDPKGRLGEPAYEAAALIRNPLADLLRRGNLRSRLARRVDMLSDALELERERILGWSLVMAVVASCWALEDADDSWKGWLDIAAALATIRRAP